MFLSESIVRAIHADRVREIERVSRERRLLASASDARTDAPASHGGVDRRSPATTRTGVPA